MTRTTINFVNDNAIVRPSVSSLPKIIEFWKNKSFAEDKGGNFNLQLYLDFVKSTKDRDHESMYNLQK